MTLRCHFQFAEVAGITLWSLQKKLILGGSISFEKKNSKGLTQGSSIYQLNNVASRFNC